MRFRGSRKNSQRSDLTESAGVRASGSATCGRPLARPIPQVGPFQAAFTLYEVGESHKNAIELGPQEGGPRNGFAVLDEVTGRTLAEEALGASAGRCQILFDVVPQPMLVYRLDTLRFIAVNDAAVRHYGYSRREFLAMTINDLCLPDDGPRSRAEPCSLDPADPPGLRTTWRHRRKDRTPIDVAISGVSLIFNGRLARVIAVNDITERKRTEEDLRQLSSRLLRSQDEERRRIARELHDATSQTLAALAINLAVVNESAGSLKPEAREALDNSFRLLETCTREIRTMSYLLHPPMLEELSLPGALRWYARGFTERSGTQVDLEMPPDLGDVPGDVALTLYRIVQEGLANIYRHSGSRSATIRLSREPSQIVLTIADRGRGIPPGVLERNPGKHSSEAAPGVGITGMKERVRQFGGRLEIQSGIQGTTVTVVLPLRQEGARSAGSSG